MRILVRLALAFVLICLFGSGQAAQVVRYAQQAAGSATGELFIDELSAGPLKVRTPSHPGLHVGIKRMGDRSLIRLVAASPPISVAELKVVLKQGDSEFPFRIPLAVGKKKKESPPESGSVPVLWNPQEPGDREESAPKEVKNTPEEKQIKEKVIVTAKAEQTKKTLEPENIESEKIEPVCPYLVVKKGSLMANVERLTQACGHVFGQWLIGDSEYLVDWRVNRERYVENAQGVNGVLELLKTEYGLLGVIRQEGEERTIDYYEYPGE